MGVVFGKALDVVVDTLVAKVELLDPPCIHMYLPLVGIAFDVKIEVVVVYRLALT